MISTKFSREELEKAVRKLEKDLGEDIRKVSSLAISDATIPLDAVINYEEILEKKGEKSIEEMSDRELRNLYRDLEYTRNLKTSTEEGAKSASENWYDVYKALNSMSEEDRKSFWDAYRFAYKETGGQIANFKYEVFEFMDLVFGEENPDINNIKLKGRNLGELLYDRYQKAIEQTEQGTLDRRDERHTDIFTSNLYRGF